MIRLNHDRDKFQSFFKNLQFPQIFYQVNLHYKSEICLLFWGQRVLNGAIKSHKILHTSLTQVFFETPCRIQIDIRYLSCISQSIYFPCFISGWNKQCRLFCRIVCVHLPAILFGRDQKHRIWKRRVDEIDLVMIWFNFYFSYFKTFEVFCTHKSEELDDLQKSTIVKISSAGIHEGYMLNKLYVLFLKLNFRIVNYEQNVFK